LNNRKSRWIRAIAALREFDDGDITEFERPKSKGFGQSCEERTKKRMMSEEGRKRIAEASRKPWAAVRKAAKKAV
jgi:hypothetical protein